MDASGVVGALIVQPINHKFDHSYVLNSIKEYPHRFKGMLLYDPSLPEEDAISRLEDLSLKGFVGVRFNPYLWPKIGDKSWETMSKGAGLATYKRCAELMMPVGVMCFQGLELHYEDILKLIKESPATTLILDHFGFTGLSENGDVAFQKLLALAEHPQVYVKISALFRLEDSVPYDRVREERLEPLLKAFGADRLMFGTDFPFVMEHDGQYHGTVERVKSWLTDETACKAVMGGTAEKLFGEWPRS
jgi:predicted TIM-barrel fold metal-dependent hydrolase